MSLKLAGEEFRNVVACAPLVSIDLVVRDPAGAILLGKRTNRPAQHDWFVPGGRILKNERMADAFSRLVREELALDLDIAQAKLLGVFEHFYPDSIWGDSVSTHYVVTAFEIQLNSTLVDLPKEQHSDYRWFGVDELLADEAVHLHSKWYFTREQGYRTEDRGDGALSGREVTPTSEAATASSPQDV